MLMLGGLTARTAA